jgi:2-oxoisovalerate ferredoxin oxidoreductase beta subunit
MPNELISEYEISHARPSAFYDRFERKEELKHQTHYCPGCGHGNVHKMLACAIDELGIQDRTILISPVGCSVFAYYYFDVGNVQAAHGRAPAVATAVKRSHPGSIVVSYQGDGDLAAIGSAEILHAANRGENITVIFVNNAVYSMTGGQVAPTTLIGQKSTTTPDGRSVANEGYPLHVCELLATLEAPVYIERVALGDNKQIAQATRAIRRAVENQVRGLGFSFIEVLSPCPTIWKMSPVEAQRWVHDVMEKTFPLGVFCDRTKEAQPRLLPEPGPSLEEIPGLLGIVDENRPEDTFNEKPRADEVDLHVRVAGFGGQGVLLLGEVVAEAGLDAGLEVSWLPSYGPEMRSGTSNCHVRVSSKPIDSPLVMLPDVLVDSKSQLRKTMGFWDVLLFNIATVLGPRWIAAAGHNGTSSISLWVLAAVFFFVPGALVINELSSRFPEEGGLYVWSREAFGPFTDSSPDGPTGSTPSSTFPACCWPALP